LEKAMILNRTSKPTLPKSDYTIVVDVQNLHIAGRKVAKGHTLSLTAAEASHWVAEGVLRAGAAAAPSSEEG
jgi:hypothetical protein